MEWSCCEGGCARSVASAAVFLACLAVSAEPAGAQDTPIDPAVGIAKLIATGRDAAALEQIKGLEASHAKVPDLDRLEGNAYFDLNQLREADAAFARALVSDPKDAAAAQMRGLTLVKLGRPADAIPLLEANHAVGAQSKADPTYVLALCYMDTRRYDDARRAFAMQFGFSPESADGYLIGARMLFRREYVPVAQQFAEKALALNPKLPLAHELLGEIALAGGHTEDAIRDFEAEKAADPLQGVVYESLGDAYSRAARYGEAEKVLQQAVLLEPNATGPLILLGKALLKEGQPVGATTYLQRAEVMDPANYRTHNLLAQAYRAMGRAEDAKRELALTEKTQAADEPVPQAPK